MPGSAECVDSVNINSFSWSSEVLAFCSRISKPSPHSLDYRLPLAFRHCCENMKHESACWSRGVNLLDHGHKVNFQRVENI
jgi:hypothetical protein